MILYTSTFTKIGSVKRSELIALLVSLLVSLFFLASFASLYEHDPMEDITCTATLTPPVVVELQQPPEWPDPNDKFRVVPENFAHVDFKNRRYGRYTFGGQKLNLVLTEEELNIPNKEGGGEQRFLLDDVFYTDVTGDGKPEAIAQIAHLQCGVSCDGASNLFYVYESTKKGLRQIWEYETGSMAYGCGLKTLIVSKQLIGVEMFGQCWKPASSFEGSGKFKVRDLTLALFRFDGSTFVHDRTNITAGPIRDVLLYIPKVLILQ